MEPFKEWNEESWSLVVRRRNAVVYQSSDTRNPDVLEHRSTWAFSSHLCDAIEKGKINNEYRFALKQQNLSNDLIVIPTHHGEHVGHWTVVGRYLKEKIILQLDSLHQKNERKFSIISCYLKNLHRINKVSFSQSQWTLISPTDIPR